MNAHSDTNAPLAVDGPNTDNRGTRAMPNAGKAATGALDAKVGLLPTRAVDAAQGLPDAPGVAVYVSGGLTVRAVAVHRLLGPVLWAEEGDPPRERVYYRLTGEVFAAFFDRYAAWLSQARALESALAKAAPTVPERGRLAGRLATLKARLDYCQPRLRALKAYLLAPGRYTEVELRSAVPRLPDATRPPIGTWEPPSEASTVQEAEAKPKLSLRPPPKPERPAPRPLPAPVTPPPSHPTPDRKPAPEWVAPGVAELAAWALAITPADLPGEPFKLFPHLRVFEPARWLAFLQNEVQIALAGKSCRPSTLATVRRLRELFGALPLVPREEVRELARRREARRRREADLRAGLNRRRAERRLLERGQRAVRAAAKAAVRAEEKEARLKPADTLKIPGEAAKARPVTDPAAND